MGKSNFNYVVTMTLRNSLCRNKTIFLGDMCKLVLIMEKIINPYFSKLL